MITAKAGWIATIKYILDSLSLSTKGIVLLNIIKHQTYTKAAATSTTNGLLQVTSSTATIFLVSMEL